MYVSFMGIKYQLLISAMVSQREIENATSRISFSSWFLVVAFSPSQCILGFVGTAFARNSFYTINGSSGSILYPTCTGMVYAPPAQAVANTPYSTLRPHTGRRNHAILLASVQAMKCTRVSKIQAEQRRVGLVGAVTGQGVGSNGNRVNISGCREGQDWQPWCFILFPFLGQICRHREKQNCAKSTGPSYPLQGKGTNACLP